MKNTNKDQKSQRENKLEPLIDLKPSGKIRNHRKLRRMSIAVGEACLQNPDLKRYGEKIMSCANCFKTMSCPDITHGKRIVEAYFCKYRLCTTCQERKSNLIRKQVIDLVHEHLKRHPSDVPLLLTTTVLNALGEDLVGTVNQMTGAWDRLTKRRSVDGVVRSSFRSLEVTYNPDRGDFHPHFHSILMMPKAYFYRKNGLYKTNGDWLRMWQQSMRDDRITQVDIRRIKPKGKGTLEAFVGEAAKYATKPSSYILENEKGKYEVNPKVIEDLHYGLRRRRLVAFGGLFNQIRKEKKLIDIEKADLVDVNGESLSCGDTHCKICQSELIEEVFRWNFGLEQYFKVIQEDEKYEDFQESEMAHAFDMFEEKETCEYHYHGLEEEVGDTSYEIKEESPQNVGSGSYDTKETLPIKEVDTSYGIEEVVPMTHEDDAIKENKEDFFDLPRYGVDELRNSPCFIELNRQPDEDKGEAKEQKEKETQVKFELIAYQKMKVRKENVRVCRSESSLLPLRGPP